MSKRKKTVVKCSNRDKVDDDSHVIARVCDNIAWMSDIQLLIRDISLEPFTGGGVVERMKQRTEHVQTLCLPCVVVCPRSRACASEVLPKFTRHLVRA